MATKRLWHHKSRKWVFEIICIRTPPRSPFFIMNTKAHCKRGEVTGVCAMTQPILSRASPGAVALSGRFKYSAHWAAFSI
jgi:hypothetical protein